jgi:hypothetical protein
VPPTLGNAMEKLLADVDGLPVAPKLPIFIRCSRVHLRRWLIECVGLCGGTPSNQPAAIVELASPRSFGPAASLPNETALRVGPLELDLLERTAKRGDRKCDRASFSCSNAWCNRATKC